MADEETGGQVEVEEEFTPTPEWRETAPHPTGSVFVETGRGLAIEVPVGQPFQETMYRLAQEVHYGGDFRVFINGAEVLDPSEAPATIEAGMRIAITPYDKPGIVE